ncbi:MAG: tetratricopeptide repeat protein [Planctomycetota bacterium]
MQLHFWKISTLVLLGATIGLVVLLVRSVPTETPPDDPETVRNRNNDVLDPFQDQDATQNNRVEPSAAVERLIQGDQFLMAGNPELALASYERFADESGTANNSLLMRQAIGYEMNGESDKAVRLYRSVISSTNNLNQRVLAASGYARILIAHGQAMDAIDLLSDQMLQFAGDEQIPVESRAQISYQWARALESNARTELKPAPDRTRKFTVPALQTSTGGRRNFLGEKKDLDEPEVVEPKRFDDLIHPRSIADYQFPIEPALLLSLIDKNVFFDPALRTLDSEFVIALKQRPTDEADTILLTAVGSMQSVDSLLGELSAQTELDIFISAAAQAMIDGRSRRVHWRGATTLAALLDQLVLPFELAWIQDERGVHIVTNSEVLDRKQLTKELRWDAADRAFRQFEVSFPDEPMRQSAIFSRAGLAFERNELDVAANLYQELMRVNPSGEILAKMFFNQAKLNLLFGRPERAKDLLYKAVDQSFDPKVRAASYCWLGRIHLTDGELEKSIHASQRGLAISVGTRQTNTATMLLARAHLLQKDPFSANQVIFENRSTLAKDSTVRPMASILGAYARSIGLSDELGQRLARERMLTAVTMIPASEFDSFVDCYISGLAMRDLGLYEKAVERLLLAMSKQDVGAWRDQLLYELAVNQEMAGQKDQAITTLTSLLEADPEWRTHALIRLSKIHAEQKRYEESLQACKSAFREELSEQQKSFLLQLMGEAFREQGQHHSAALCFAGMLPDSL